MIARVIFIYRSNSHFVKLSQSCKIKEQKVDHFVWLWKLEIAVIIHFFVVIFLRFVFYLQPFEFTSGTQTGIFLNSISIRSWEDFEIQIMYLKKFAHFINL